MTRKNDDAPDKVHVSIERVYRLGKWESVRVTMGESKTVLPGDDRAEVRYEIAEQLYEDIEKTADMIDTMEQDKEE